jgi:hypothetical protein
MSKKSINNFRELYKKHLFDIQEAIKDSAGEAIPRDKVHRLAEGVLALIFNNPTVTKEMIEKVVTSSVEKSKRPEVLTNIGEAVLKAIYNKNEYDHF